MYGWAYGTMKYFKVFFKQKLMRLIGVIRYKQGAQNAFLSTSYCCSFGLIISAFWYCYLSFRLGPVFPLWVKFFSNSNDLLYLIIASLLSIMSSIHSKGGFYMQGIVITLENRQERDMVPGTKKLKIWKGIRVTCVTKGWHKIKEK